MLYSGKRLLVGCLVDVNVSAELTAQFLFSQHDPLGWPPSQPERVQRLSVPTRELRPIGRMSELYRSQRKRTAHECDSYR